MKQHVTYITMLLAAVCGTAVQRVAASYSDRLLADDGGLHRPAICGVPMRPAKRFGSDREPGSVLSAGAYTVAMPGLGDRHVTLDTLGMTPRGGLRPVYWSFRHDGRSTQGVGPSHRTPFELFGITPFSDGYGALSAWDSNSWRSRLDGVHFEVEPGTVFVATAAPASLSERYGSDRAAAPGATATIFSSPGAVLLIAIGVALIGQLRRKTLL